MTYQELLEMVSTLTEEQRKMDVTVVLLDKEEVFPVEDFVTKWESPGHKNDSLGTDIVDCVLDDNHPYLTIDF